MCLRDVDRDHFTFLPLTFRVAAVFRTMDSLLENAVRPKHRLKQHLYSVRREFKASQKRSAFSTRVGILILATLL